MKVSVTSLPKANRFNDWSAYQKSGYGVGTLFRKAFLRPLFTEVSPSVVSPVSKLSFWKRLVIWFKSFFKKFFHA